MRDRSFTLASLGAAVVASLCCIGPLVSAAIGVGAIGIFGALETARPYFLLLAAALIGGAFYVNTQSRRVAECAEGSCPVIPRRWNKVFLWLSAASIVLIAAFPYYSGALLTRTAIDNTVAAKAAVSEGSAVTIHIDGMTCAGCAAAVESAVGRLDGVHRVIVSLEQKNAVVEFDPSRTSPDRIRSTIEATGFKATL